MRPLSYLLSVSASLLLSLSTATAAEKPAPTITHTSVANPAGPGALGASLTTAADGTLWLTWVEPGATDASPSLLRFSTFAPTTRMWSPAATVGSSPLPPLNAGDHPQLVVNGPRSASVAAEKFSFVRLADGRVLAAWIESRPSAPAQLFARVHPPSPSSPNSPSSSPSTHPATLIDPSISENSAPALTAFPDGGALLAYRGRAEGNVHDIRTARFRGTAWDESRPLNNDDWRVATSPAHGPRLASDGGRVSAVWFTAADHDPRVLVSYSPDAGTRFLLPLRLDNGKPAGQPDTVILRDGAILATWLETDGSLWLRRVSPDFAADDPVALAPPGTVSLQTHPRLALLRDYTGGTESAQLLVAFTAGNTVRTLHINVPEGELLTAKGNCDCAPTPEQLMGYAARGAVAAISTERGTIHLVHEEFPGLLFAGTHEFRADPSVLSAVQLGRRLFGRIEKRSGQWWLYDVRLAQNP